MANTKKVWTRAWDAGKGIYDSIFEQKPINSKLASADFKKGGALSYWEGYYSG